jgi:N-acetylglucosaminyldiphosphoundecaprenol N-acetyl-beta-D-mannosaminyltransferase
MSPRAANFLGQSLAQDLDQRALLRLLTDRPAAPRAIAYLNAHTTNLAQRHPAVWRAMDVLYPDGMAVVWGARLLGLSVPARLSAADFFLPFCRLAARRGRTIALVGGDDGLALRCAAVLARRIPALRVVYTSHGWLPPGSIARRRVVEGLATARPDIVLLGMGSPQQEVFAAELREAGVAPTIWCVGALFEYFVPGHRPRAPRWMCRAGLEWLFRLVQEPRRLARRYLWGNLVYTATVARALLRRGR